jgi:hypothetical protein
MTATELGATIGLSRARIYQLIRQGRFPAPQKGEHSSRSFFSAESVKIVLRIKADGIALDGMPIVFNRVNKQRMKAEVRSQLQCPINPLLEYLEGLGLTVTASELDRALAALYPGGWQTHPQEEVVARVYQTLLEDRQ